MKPGQKTSEFFVAIGTVLGLLAASLGGVLPTHWAALGATVVSAAYTIGRSFVKAGGAEALENLAADETPAMAPVAIVPPAA
jgi:hypothetical protein